jgi:hypothetical protein
MLKITALFTTLALAATASIASASPARSYDRRPGIESTRAYGRAALRVDGFARTARLDPLDRWHRGAAFDDVGPRRYRPTWVALGAPHRLGASRVSIEVRDPGTFTQLRLQSDAGYSSVGCVTVQFADGTEQVAELGRDLDRRGEFVELPLDRNNRRIARILVTGALGDLQVFGI